MELENRTWKRFGLLAALIFAIAAPASAAKILVHGRAVVGVEPDIAVLDIGVSTWSKDAEISQNENSKAMNALIDALLKQGIERIDMQTSQYRLNKQPESFRGQGSEQDGFQISNDLRVIVRDLKKLPVIMTTAVKTGGNQISSLGFLVAKPTPYVDQARKKAFENAKGEAQLSVQAVGLTLGEISSIANGRATLPQSGYFGSADLPAANPPDPDVLPVTLPGQVDIGYEVDVEYEVITPK
jgi:uncharacterized protein